MRTRCAVAVGLLLALAPGASHAQEAAPISTSTEADRPTRVTMRTTYYEQHDPGRKGNPFLDESLVVIEPAVLFEKEVGDGVDATLLLTHDYISSASVSRLDYYPDQSGASGDYYASIDAGVDARVRDGTRLGATAHGSFERDYLSAGLALRAAQDLPWGDAVRLGVSGYHDEVLKIFFDGTYNGWADRQTASFELTYYRPLTPWLHAEAAYAFSWQGGFLETNFNAVVIEGGPNPPNPLLTGFFPGREVREELPDRRLRHTGLGRIRAMLEATGTSLELAGRLYGDSWGITSRTIEPSLRQWLVRDALLARLGYRYVLQRAARAWHRHFTIALHHRTQDPDLGPLEVHALGVGLEWTPTATWAIDVGGELVWRSDGLDQRWLTAGVRFEF